MAPIKVIGLAMSTCTQRALVVMIEKGVEFVIEPLNVMKGDNKKPEYLAIQPFGQIPVIKDEDFTLFESRAIGRYICMKYEHQGTPLYGKDLKEKALVEQWLAVEVEELATPISTLVYQLVLGPRYKGLTTVDEAIVSHNLEKLGKVLDVYEAQLSKTRFLAGDFVSLADLVHLPYVYLLVEESKKKEVVTSRHNVHAWYQRISSLPSWKKVLQLSAAP